MALIHQIGFVSDTPIRLAGLASVFDQALVVDKARLHLSPVVGSIPELLALSTLDYLVLDLGHEPSRGLDALRAIRLAHPAIRLIVIGLHGNDELAMESIISGAKAYLVETADVATIRQAIEVVADGSIWAPHHLLSRLVDRLLNVTDSSLTNSPLHLTPREKEVLEQILLARSNREIARHLGIEERTVKAHVSRLLRKTGANNRVELSLRALTCRPVAPTHLKHRWQR